MLTLNNDCLASVTAVPDLFLEQYMPAANGEFVKVYLYLLKLVKDHQQDSTLSSMADFFSWRIILPISLATLSLVW